MNNPKKAAKNKLKRNRMLNGNNGDLRLFEDSNGPSVVTKIPTPDSPATRIFVPPKGLNVDKNFQQLGVVDWREEAFQKITSIKDLNNKIICSDSKAALKRFPEDSVHCIITSPPYWNMVDYGFDGQLGQCSYEKYLMQLLEVWSECERVLAPNGKLCIITPIMPISKKVIPDQHTRHLKNINNDIEATILTNLRLRRYSLYIWQKQTTEKMFGSYPYPPNIYEQNTIEFINVLVKDGKPRQMEQAVKEASKLNEKEWMDLTRQIWPLYPEDVKRVNHPAPFPISLPNRLIAMYTFARCQNEKFSYEGDVVLDPFCGAGATCVAAKNLGRNHIGVDLSPEFCVFAGENLRKTFYSGKIFLINNKNWAGNDKVRSSFQR